MQIEAKIEKTVTKTGTITLTMGIGEATQLLELLNNVSLNDLQNTKKIFSDVNVLAVNDFFALTKFRELLKKGIEAE